MMTAEEYIQSLRDLRPRRVYAFGEKIEDCVGHPLIRPSINLLRHDLQAGRDA